MESMIKERDRFAPTFSHGVELAPANSISPPLLTPPPLLSSPFLSSAHHDEQVWQRLVLGTDQWIRWRELRIVAPLPTISGDVIFHCSVGEGGSHALLG